MNLIFDGRDAVLRGPQTVEEFEWHDEISYFVRSTAGITFSHRARAAEPVKTEHAVVRERIKQMGAEKKNKQVLSTRVSQDIQPYILSQVQLNGSMSMHISKARTEPQDIS